MFGGAGGTHFPYRAQKAQACKIEAPGGESRKAAAVVVNFMAVSSYRENYRDKKCLELYLCNGNVLGDLLAFCHL